MKQNLKYIKLFVVLIIVAALAWFLIIKPLEMFKGYEHEMEEAARRYYEFNSEELPTGSRVGTIKMQTLYHKAYIKEDFTIPYTNEPCDMVNSWVKVKRVNGEYQYYTYLKCGALESTVDNDGPDIKLNGSQEITLNIGDKYEEPGVKSVADKTDGKIDVKEVKINSKEVDTSKVGTYEVIYSVYDSFKNKSEVKRTVKVISKLKRAVEHATDKKGYYVGQNPNNYLMLSGMMFRIIGIDGDNVKVIAEEDISNVNYEGIEAWMDYYLDHFNEESKKLLVKNEYCNMPVEIDSIDTVKECTSKTSSRYAYIPSADEINRAKDESGSFMYPSTLSWTANKNSEGNAFATRNIMFGGVTSDHYYADKLINNYGVRPVLTIKGSSLLKSGDGTKDSPYSFGEVKTGKADELINSRYPGEYITYGGVIWRIVEANKDGTTKVISLNNVQKDGKAVMIRHETDKAKKIYNPEEKGNVGYNIKNKVSEFIDTTYFVNREVEVPIYEADILYKKETKTKKYKVKLSAPNTYEMFSAQSTADIEYRSYWLINSSDKQFYKGAVTDAGVVLSEAVPDTKDFGIRIVGNLHKSVMITKGKGTAKEPYNISK